MALKEATPSPRADCAVKPVVLLAEHVGPSGDRVAP